MSKQKHPGADSLSPLSGRELERHSYHLNGEAYIELIKLLKIMRIAESGGQAKLMVEDGIVIRNGEPEFRKRAKLISGDEIKVSGYQVKVL